MLVVIRYGMGRMTDMAKKGGRRPRGRIGGLTGSRTANDHGRNEEAVNLVDDPRCDFRIDCVLLLADYRDGIVLRRRRRRRPRNGGRHLLASSRAE